MVGITHFLEIPRHFLKILENSVAKMRKICYNLDNEFVENWTNLKNFNKGGRIGGIKVRDVTMKDVNNRCQKSNRYIQVLSVQK